MYPLLSLPFFSAYHKQSIANPKQKKIENLLLLLQVKESSRLAKHAYKDLKTKLRDITPPNPSSSSHLHHNNNNNFRSHLNSNTPHDRLDGVSVGSSGYVTSVSGKDSAGKSLKTYLGRHSAPSSPVFCKRIGSSSAAVFQYAPKDQITNASQHLRRGPTTLAMSNSSTHIQSNGYAKSSPISFNHNHHLASSPTISPASSLCSSEMNLSQELQNHPLFKSPIVDRSVSMNFGFFIFSFMCFYYLFLRFRAYKC